jgi:Trypsin
VNSDVQSALGPTGRMFCLGASKRALVCFSLIVVGGGSSAVEAGELVPATFLEQQGKAAKAADSYATALYGSDSQRYVHALKAALNSSPVLSSLFPSSSFPSAWTSATEPYVGITHFDRDPRYVTNVKTLVLNTDASNPRVWGGLPTSGYLNTVVVSGPSGLCSGTAIARNAVLTAQHCHCDGVNRFVAIGSTFDGLHPGIAVAQSVPMKNCDQPVTAAADVALLILKSNLDPSVVPATFASSALIDSAKTVRVVGFGKDSNGHVGQKLFVDIPLASTDCAGAVTGVNGTSVPDSVYYGCNNGFELVAGAALLDKDTCNGDSGGPAFVQDNAGNDFLAGATSRAVAYPGARPCGDGGIYVRVDGPVRTWLSSQGVRLTGSPN